MSRPVSPYEYDDNEATMTPFAPLSLGQGWQWRLNGDSGDPLTMAIGDNDASGLPMLTMIISILWRQWWSFGINGVIDGSVQWCQWMAILAMISAFNANGAIVVI